jgi:CRP/FNR family cyclic AMP-dependent transcriptional regulator
MSSGPARALMGETMATRRGRSPEETARFGREWVSVLEDVPLFQGLSKRDIRRVAKMAAKVTFPERSVIVSPRRGGDAFYVIIDGQAEVTTKTGERIALHSGSFFGEMALLDRGERTATVSAATEVLAMAISQQRFRELLEEEPKIAYAIMRELAARVRRLEQNAQS